MNLLTRIGRAARRILPVEARWFPTFGAGAGVGKYDPQWWQKGVSSRADASASTAAYACVNILAGEIASLQVAHWQVGAGGSRVKRTDTAVARLLRKPNPYQRRPDFWLWIVPQLLFCGTAYAIATRNGRFEIEALHTQPQNAVMPRVDRETGAVFYQASDFGDGLFAPADKIIPQRNVLALRLNASRHPLLGETPIQAYAASAAAGTTIQAQAASIVANMGRPNGVLTTEQTLTKEQRREMEQRWHELTSGTNAGKTPALSNGVKFESTVMSAVDAELIETYKLTVRDIAMAYRVPLFMLGDLEKLTFTNIESQMRLFYQSGLRFYIEYIESALNDLFGLDGESEYIEFDLESGLLRSDLVTRMEAYAKGVQGGIMAPNEARRAEQLPPVKGGDQVFVQQQMIPVAIAAEKKAEPATPPPATPAPEAPAEPAKAAVQAPAGVQRTDKDFIKFQIIQGMRASSHRRMTRCPLTSTETPA